MYKKDLINVNKRFTLKLSYDHLISSIGTVQ